MSEIVKGAPTGERSHSGVIAGLIPVVEAAKSEPGEWFSIEMPAGLKQGSAQTAAQTAVARVFAEWSTQGGRIWIRIKP